MARRIEPTGFGQGSTKTLELSDGVLSMPMTSGRREGDDIKLRGSRHLEVA